MFIKYTLFFNLFMRYFLLILISLEYIQGTTLILTLHPDLIESIRTEPKGIQKTRELFNFHLFLSLPT